MISRTDTLGTLLQCLQYRIKLLILLTVLKKVYKIKTNIIQIILKYLSRFKVLKVLNVQVKYEKTIDIYIDLIS